MIADIILVVLGLLGLLVAVVVDVRKREIPDWVSYGMIFAGFGIRLIHSIVFAEWGYFLYAWIGFALASVIGVGFYYAKQWGGGDAKLLMALGVIFATKPFFVPEGEFTLGILGPLPFAFIILFNIFIFGALYGVVYGAVLALRHRKKFLKELKFLNQKKKTRQMKVTMLLLALALFGVVLFFIDDLWTRLIANTLIVFILVFPYVKIFVKAVENGCLYHMKPVKEVTEGDWVEQDVVIKGKVIYKKKPLGIEKEDIEKLKHAGVQQVLVKEGIPFAPPFLVGVVVTLLIGRILLAF